jgi:spermidine/putrescine transport system substrate-binding protein/spermidine/putrescine transport system permease protein
VSKDALRVLTWPDYAIRGVEKLFGSATGLAVEWNFFDQNEEAFARVRAAPDRYDVILADGYWPRAYMGSGLIEPLDPMLTQGWPHLLPAIRRWCSKSWDSGSGTVMAFPCYWGLRGIIYDRDLVSQPTSWGALSSAPPRALWLNSQGSEVIAEVALGMGIEPERVYDLSDAELAEVGSKLAGMEPVVGGVWRVLPELVIAFQQGAALAEVHTTSLLDNVVRESGRSLEVAVPNEGTIAYIDGAMIGASSRLREAALSFIDTLSSPEGVLAQWRESDGYPCANAVGLDLLRGQPESGAKLDRSRATPDALEQAIIYCPPSNMHGYINAWRSFLALLDAPVPESVRSAMGLSG